MMYKKGILLLANEDVCSGAGVTGKGIKLKEPFGPETLMSACFEGIYSDLADLMVACLLGCPRS